jgi:CO dehydrogenase nickel-insertion accessory protein CooC1
MKILICGKGGTGNRVIAPIPLDRRVFERGFDGSELDFELEGAGKIDDFLDGMAGTT